MALIGVARTKIAFTSDRDGERIKGPIADRGISNLYIADYDGAQADTRDDLASDGHLARLVAGRALHRVLVLADAAIRISIILFPYGGPPLQNPTRGTAEKQSYLPAWSPDGSKLAFTSSRDGNPEIYSMNRDGSGVRRVTNHPTIDATPTWSPTGTQIAFTSDRTGSPQIYIVNADGTGLQQITRESWCDRPTWSPAPVQRDCLLVAIGSGQYHQDLRLPEQIVARRSPTTSATTRARHSRRTASTSRSYRRRKGKEQIFTIDARRQESAADHQFGRESLPELVSLRTTTGEMQLK